MLKEVEKLEEFSEIIEVNDAVLFYFSHEQCNVCKVLKPKVEEFVSSSFPKIELFYCDTIKSPEIAAQNSIFAVPTIMVYFAGRETIRKSRNVGIDELELELERPYRMIFE